MTNFYQKIKKNEKGFTLVELMVVVVIIGILVVIAIPVYNNVQNTAKANADDANVRIIEGAIEMYLLNGGSLEVLGAKGLNELEPDYLKEIPDSPYGEGYTYSVTVNGDTYTVNETKP